MKFDYCARTKCLTFSLTNWFWKLGKLIFKIFWNWSKIVNAILDEIWNFKFVKTEAVVANPRNKKRCTEYRNLFRYIVRVWWLRITVPNFVRASLKDEDVEVYIYYMIYLGDFWIWQTHGRWTDATDERTLILISSPVQHHPPHRPFSGGVTKRRSIPPLFVSLSYLAILCICSTTNWRGPVSQFCPPSGKWVFLTNASATTLRDWLPVWGRFRLNGSSRFN